MMFSTLSTPSGTASDARNSAIAEVDAAVREVLGWMGNGMSNHERGPHAKDRSANNYEIVNRLLSLRQVESLPTAIREIRLAPATVVTPLARDLLKKRGIAIRLLSRAELSRGAHQGEWGFAIDLGTARSTWGMINSLRRSWIEDDWRDLEGSLESATSWVADQPHRGVVFLTDEAALAVWRACRVEGVRAACLSEPDAVARAVRGLGVNFVVVEPCGKSISWIRQLGLAFRRFGRLPLLSQS